VLPISELLNQKKLEPVELARWIEAHADRIRDRWLSSIENRGGGSGESVEGLTVEFFDLFLAMLPHALGPYKNEVEPLWLQAAALFGSMAFQRGLAAGEVVEEFQGLRDAVIRFLYTEPPVKGPQRISLRDLLRVNRFIDRGVTQASVGHTDALFFALFQGNGVSAGFTAVNVEEIIEQLGGMREEFRDVERAFPSR
jgi:hypothetical protein